MSALEPAVSRVLGEVERLAREKIHNAVLRDVNTVQEPQTSVRVTASDCGPSGALSIGRALELAWHIRQLHLLQFYDIDVSTHTRRWNAEWVVETAEARIVAPIRPLEEVIVRTRVIASGPTTCTVEAWFLDRSGKRLKAVFRLGAIHRDLETGEPTRPTDAVVVLLARVRVDAGAPDLSARCTEILSALRQP